MCLEKQSGGDMTYIRLIKTNRAFTMIELMIVIAIFAILAAIAIPNYISYRHKAYCSQAEADAANIESAIADYFGTPTRTKCPSIDDLKVSVINPDPVIIGADPNVHITIQIIDRTGRCPLDYQSGTPGWDGNYHFLKEIK